MAIKIVSILCLMMILHTRFAIPLAEEDLGDGGIFNPNSCCSECHTVDTRANYYVFSRDKLQCDCQTKFYGTNYYGPNSNVRFTHSINFIVTLNSATIDPGLPSEVAGLCECPPEKGSCVLPSGSRQESGKILLQDNIDGRSAEQQESCLSKCLLYPGATGCEVTWGLDWPGCYVHTQEVHRGSGDCGENNAACWAFSKCAHGDGVKTIQMPGSKTSPGAERAKTCSCAGEINCCPEFTTGDNDGTGGEKFVQEEEYNTEKGCKGTCMDLYPDSTGITESLTQEYATKRANKCWCEMGDPILKENAGYQTCMFK